MSDNRNQTDLKKFIIKLVAVTFAIIVVINVTYNLIFADKLENINKILLLNKKENIESLKDKIRSELKQGLEKDQILNKEDKILIYKFYLKIKNEFKDIEN
ncbi:MAG: hypothetical protein CBD56_00240 [Candidatus Pelagibacter sp. TMED196]|nr:MAG: hypothetical protein CBD56_00240 [Candidatus Pelagibacter sp. TMED196]|tara:strand:+ start:1709 stop:2011 length:303 start_codon:yes stop_codon:yes gene_type:complete